MHPCPPPQLIRNTWTSVPKTNVAYNNLNQAATFSYIIPSVIPSDAKNILILAFSGLGPPKMDYMALEEML